jgi:ubiquinone/menaquinone biosynthesis C-methylase UbiE
MKWWELPRRPEPEVMDDSDEVEAYASAAAEAFLDSIDNTLVEQVIALAPERGRLLDLGCGPGGIALKLARRLPGVTVFGADYSLNMIRAARRAAAEQGLAERAHFFVADANRLAFPESSFDFVLSNSLLHHLREPVRVLKEMARVARPEGVLLMRDLRRPSRLAFPLHVRWFGRYYSGLMYKLYCDSVRAAYTGEELTDLLARSGLRDAKIFFHERTHLGFVRPPRSGALPPWRVGEEER